MYWTNFTNLNSLFIVILEGDLLDIRKSWHNFVDIVCKYFKALYDNRLFPRSLRL